MVPLGMPTWEAALLPFDISIFLLFLSLKCSPGDADTTTTPHSVVLSISQPAAMHCQPSKCCQMSCPFEKNVGSCRAWAAKKVCADP